MKRILLLSLVLTACTPPPTNLIPTTVATQENTDRFTVQQVSQFYDANAYNNYRGIYIIHDQVTNKDYVGVTGIGISETGSHTVTNGETTEEVKHEQ